MGFGYLLMRETEDLAKLYRTAEESVPGYFFNLVLLLYSLSLCCMKVGFTPLKGILLSAMMGFFYLLYFIQLSLDNFFCRL